MRASCVTTESAPTSGICSGTLPVSIRRPTTSFSATSGRKRCGATWATTFRPVLDASPGYSIREQLTVPLDLQRERVDLFHAPHYVLPPLTPCRSVVTIHDCIHLRFPQYLPNRLAYAYARSSLWIATHRASRILTVSETSKRDILDFFNVPESKIDVIYNAIDERFWSPPPIRTRSIASASATSSTIRSCSTPATSSRTRTSNG